MVEKLKPCPKCGGDHGWPEQYLNEYWVRCMDQNCGYSTNTHLNAKDALAEWNRKEQT